MNIPIYNCLIDEDPQDETGIYAISFVDEPANETNFITLKKQAYEHHLNLNSQKQILTGVVLCPEQLIYRSSPQLGEHYIKFSAQQIEKISHKMMRTSLALNNTTHQHQKPLKGNYLIELWIVEDPRNDKSNALGFQDLPKGTLMCSYKIEDKKYWDTQVLSGNVKGFSLEGFFFQQEMKRHSKSNFNKQTNMNRKDKSSLLGKIGRFFLDIEAVQKTDATQSGTAYVSFTLDDGKEVHVDADGFATLDGEQLPAGEHTLADGNVLTVDKDGQFIETKESSTKSTTPDTANAPQTLRRQMRSRLASEKGIVPNETPSTGKPATDTNDLNARIAELEASVEDLQKQIDEILKSSDKAKAEVESLRRNTPGAFPMTQAHRSSRRQNASYTERMATSLSMQILRKK